MLKLSDSENRLVTITPGILTICTYTEFAPFSYEEDGSIVGTDISFLKNFAAEMDLKVKILKKDFSGLW